MRAPRASVPNDSDEWERPELPPDGKPDLCGTASVGADRLRSRGVSVQRSLYVARILDRVRIR
jgi:hypothetical protein